MAQRRLVYLCPTILHLMNCIVTQMTINKGIPADIVFEDTTDFSVIKERLKKHNIFENFYLFPYAANSLSFRQLKGKKRKAVVKKPSKLFDIPKFPCKYTDMLANIDSLAPKLFYYELISQGMRPKVHFVSEGTGSYSLDFVNTKTDKMFHERFRNKSFLKNIENLYLYKPELYTGGSSLVNLVNLPSYASLSNEIFEVVEDVFGKADPIEEKVIFFEGTFGGDGYLVDEMDIFLTIANIVGKDNIVIKRHPRNPVDRFTALGYKVMENQNIPWEVMIKDIDLSQKLLISVASFTCFSSMEMYGRSCYSILLKDIIKGRVTFLKNDGYVKFFTRAEEVFRKNEIYSWSPSSLEELIMVLDIVEEKIGGWQN